MKTLPPIFAPNPHLLTAQRRALDVTLELIELDQRLYEIAEGLPIPPTFVGMAEFLIPYVCPTRWRLGSASRLKKRPSSPRSATGR